MDRVEGWGRKKEARIVWRQRMKGDGEGGEGVGKVAEMLMQGKGVDWESRGLKGRWGESRLVVGGTGKVFKGKTP